MYTNRTKSCVYKPSFWPQCITLCARWWPKRMWVWLKGIVGANLEFITTAKIGLPSALCSHYLPLLFVGSFHKPVQLTPQKVLGWVSKSAGGKALMKFRVGAKDGAGPHSQLQGQEKGWIEKKREQDLLVWGSMFLQTYSLSITNFIIRAIAVAPSDTCPSISYLL